MSDEYVKLKAEFDETGETSQEFFDVQNRLKDLIPELSGNFDEYGNFILDDKNKMEELTKATLEQIDAEKKLQQKTIDKSAKILAQELTSTYSKKTLADKGKVGGYHGLEVAAGEEEIIQINLDWSKAIEDSKSKFRLMSSEAQQAFLSELNKTEGGKTIAEAILSEYSPDDFYKKLYTPDPSTVVGVAQNLAEESYAAFSETIKALSDSGDTIDGLISKSMEEGLTIGDVASMPPEYMEALEVQGDKLRVNIDLLKQIQLEEAKSALATIQSQFEKKRSYGSTSGRCSICIRPIACCISKFIWGI